MWLADAALLEIRKSPNQVGGSTCRCQNDDRGGDCEKCVHWTCGGHYWGRGWPGRGWLSGSRGRSGDGRSGCGTSRSGCVGGRGSAYGWRRSTRAGPGRPTGGESRKFNGRRCRRLRRQVNPNRLFFGLDFAGLLFGRNGPGRNIRNVVRHNLNWLKAKIACGECQT